MRQLTRFDEEALARKLCDFMLAEGIDAKVDESVDGGFSLWVLDDAHLEGARDLLELFERDPASPRVEEGLAEMRRRRRERAEGEAEVLRRIAAMQRTQRLAAQVRSAGPVTHFMVFATLGFAAMATFFSGGDPSRVFVHLSATPEALAAGEVWRLFTPVFVRFGLPHPVAVLGVLLGVFWLRTLGAPIERLHGSFVLALMLLGSAGLSTAVELALFEVSVGGSMGSAAMLFAYLWLRGRLDPSMPIRLRPDISLWIGAWLVLSLVGPGGEQFAPRWGVGLALGALWALVVSLRARRR